MEHFFAQNIGSLIELGTVLAAVIGSYYNIKIEMRGIKSDIKSMNEKIVGIECDRDKRWMRQDTLNDSQGKYVMQMAQDVSAIKAKIEIYFDTHVKK